MSEPDRLNFSASLHPSLSGERLPQHPLPGDRREVARLWQEVFQDSGEFVDLFFSRVYKPENTLVMKRGNRIISALQMIPYGIKTVRGVIPSAYVCGVCTHPSERGKGYAKTLMAVAMEEMRRRGYSVSTLIPAEPRLYDFYGKYGYTCPVNHETETYSSVRQLPDAARPVTDSPDYTFAGYATDRHFPFFDRKQRERRCAVLHDADGLETIVRDLACDGGGAWVALRENIPAGMAFAKPETEGKITVREILFDHPAVKEALIHHVLNLYGARTAEVHLPFRAEDSHTSLPVSRETKPYGLACILDGQTVDISDLYMTLMLD
ncbi:MAG: GNAT family N-acetyltransferase [Tannerella sp.]|jgi:GNAT superfamily N-acetyltransferase|nr:GNAT family N-acetyltransferase [Tannerella sp.]